MTVSPQGSNDQRRVRVPDAWYLGAHGDPVAVFAEGGLVLVLHDDGTVTWEKHDE